MAASPDSERTVLTGGPGAAYIANTMANPGGFNAEKLARDAIAAQAGDRSARGRLLRVFRQPRLTVKLRRRQPRREGRRRPAARPRRRTGAHRARAPGRSSGCDLDPPQCFARCAAEVSG